MDLVVLTELPGCQLLATGRVLKAPDAGQVMKATELLAYAHRRSAEADGQAGAALARAREEGLAAGRAQARAEYADRLAAAAAARHAGLHSLAPVMVDIVVDALAVMLRQADRAQLWAGALAAVQELLGRARWARMRVHPRQEAVALRALAQAGASFVTVQPDATLGDEECRLETDVGIADAGLQVQLQALRRAVAQALETTEPPPEPAPRT